MRVHKLDSNYAHIVDASSNVQELVKTFLWYNTNNILLVQVKDLMEQKPTDLSISKNSDCI